MSDTELARQWKDGRGRILWQPVSEGECLAHNIDWGIHWSPLTRESSPMVYRWKWRAERVARKRRKYRLSRQLTLVDPQS